MIGGKELRLVAAIAAVAVLGLLVQASGDPVAAPRPEARQSGGFVERSVFCPPAPSAEATVSAVAASNGDTEMTVAYEPSGATKEVPKGTSVVEQADGEGLTVVGFGAPVSAGATGAFTAPAEGSSGSSCAVTTSETWYFPFGTSDLGYSERILLYNPFPDEAVAQVIFADTAGERAKAGLDDIAIPAGSSTEIEINEFVGTQPFVSTRVEAVRGRFAAWRVIFHKPENGPRGVSMTLGAPVASDTWYFAEGVLGAGGGQAMGIINPTDEEALVNVSLVTGNKVIAPPKDLLEIKVARQTAETVRFDAIPGLSEKTLSHASAIVSTSNGVDIVVERKMAAETGELEGVSTEVGSSVIARSWMVPPPVPDAQTDTVSILNPTSKKATVSILLRTREGTKSPKELSSIEVPPGLRRQVPLGAYSGGPAVALVSSDQPIVAERSGRSVADIGDVLGMPVGVDPSLEAGS
jgi:Family of unknown function (DUF5719)